MGLATAFCEGTMDNELGQQGAGPGIVAPVSSRTPVATNQGARMRSLRL